MKDHNLTLIATVLLVITISMSGVFFDDAFAAFSPTQPNALVSYNSATNEVQVEWNYTTGGVDAPETCLLKGDFYFYTDVNTKFDTNGVRDVDYTEIYGFIPLHYSVVSSSPETNGAGTAEVIPCEGEIRIDIDTVMSHESNIDLDGNQPLDLQIFLSFYAIDADDDIETFNFASATFMDEIFVFYTPTATWSTAAIDYACAGQAGNTIYIDQSAKGIHGNNGDNCGVYVELNSNQYVDIATDGTQTPGDHTAQSFPEWMIVSTGGGSNICFYGCGVPTMGISSNGNRIVEGGFTYNGQTVDVDRGHTPFEEITANIGDDNHVTVKIYDNEGINGLRLVQFALGVPYINAPIDLAEARIAIQFQYGGSDIEKITITDDDNLIDNDKIIVGTTIVDCAENSDKECTAVTLHYTYREAPIHNIMQVMIMDVHRYSEINSFNDGIDVVGESLNPADTTSTHVPNIQYPQKSGMVELTQIDREEKLWVDAYGYIWQGDDSKMVLISEMPYDLYDDDAKSPFSGYNNRINSHFGDYKQEQLNKAIALFDSSLIQNELSDTFTHTYPVTVDRLDSLAEKLKAAEMRIIQAYETKYPGADRGVDNFEG